MRLKITGINNNVHPNVEHVQTDIWLWQYQNYQYSRYRYAAYIQGASKYIEFRSFRMVYKYIFHVLLQNFW